jgi:hypothetical protein
MGEAGIMCGGERSIAHQISPTAESTGRFVDDGGDRLQVRSGIRVRLAVHCLATPIDPNCTERDAGAAECGGAQLHGFGSAVV